MKQILVCPNDRTPLTLNENIGHCSKCESDYVNKDGIWKLASSNNMPGHANVTKWFDKRAETIEDEQILRGTIDKWHKRYFEKDASQISNLLQPKKTDSFLDIGCGNGLFLEKYANCIKEAVGTDISFKMLKRARQHLKNKNILLVQANSLKLPFASNTFNKILCNWVIHYFKPDEIFKFFAELKRVAKKEARIFIGEIPLRHSLRNYEANIGHFLVNNIKIKVSDRHLSPVKTTKFKPKDIKNFAEKAGLKIISQGTMQHVLPSLRIPHIGQLVPNRVQHLFERYDYKKSIPLVSYSYFVVLSGANFQ